MNESILLLAPSSGLGGGIERYVDTLESALREHKRTYRRLDVVDAHRSGGLRNKLRFVREVATAVRVSRTPVRLVLAHRNLIPMVPMLSGLRNFAGAVVILHGAEIWTGRSIRGRRMLRRPDVRAVAVSNFSAGVLARVCHANVLQPGVSRAWYDTLVAAGMRARPGVGPLTLVTVCRLEVWRDKGIDTILDAVELLNSDRIQLTICGSGRVAPELAARVCRSDRVRIAANVADDVLADYLANADLFVLATRTRCGARAAGEGFGLVLLEAQLAGTPVVAPAYGGSGDAFQPGVTGVAPNDESPEALARVLARFLDTQLRRDMAQAAAAWSRQRFEPAAYAEHVVRTLLGEPKFPSSAENGAMRTPPMPRREVKPVRGRRAVGIPGEN